MREPFVGIFWCLLIAALFMGAFSLLAGCAGPRDAFELARIATKAAKDGHVR